MIGPCHEVQKWTEDGQFCPRSRRVPKTSRRRFVVYGGPTGSRLVGFFSWDDGLQSPSGGIGHCFADLPENRKGWPEHH